MLANFLTNPIVLFILGMLSTLIIAALVMQIRKRVLTLRITPPYYPNRLSSGHYSPRNVVHLREVERFLQQEEDLDIRRDLYHRYRRLLDEPLSPQSKREMIYLTELARRRLTEGPSSRRTEEIVDEKKNKFLNIPSIAFHYANKEQITSFYNDYFKEPTVASLVSEISGELTGEIKGSLPQILESKLGSKDLSKWISTLKLPDISLNGMFLRYQRETIKSGQVQLGLEEVEIEFTELQAFDEALSDLQKRFEFQLEDKLLQKQRAHLKEKAAERTLLKLEQATGWVLIEGRFEIEIEGDFYKCTLSHPVNDYLSGQLGPITISVLIPTSSIESHTAGNYRQSIGKLIPMRIYGQVWQPIDRKANIWDLQLTPLAIY